MKSLVGLLLVISGTILAIPQIYEALAYLEYDRWPIVQGALGITCIVVGLVFLVHKKPSSEKKVFTEVS